MTLSVPNTAKAVLIGASNFPKDETLSPIEQAENNIKSVAQVLANSSIIGVTEENIVRMIDVPDNTKIKEEVSIAAEEAKGAMIVYITGHITTRKGHLYLATPNSSRKKIHINGIALDELLDIISETNAETRILIFDAYYSDVNDEETEGDVVVDALKHYESAYLNTFILSASPAANFVGFKGNAEHTAFTSALLETLQNGLDREQETLTLEDIHEGIKEQMAGQVPLKSTASKADKVTFAYNTKFLGFRELKDAADDFFDKEQFQEALDTYEEAAKLFGKNTEVKKRKKFIKRFLDGEKAIEKGNFNKAKDSFLEAQDIYELKVVAEKINGVVMTIANTLFDKEEYEQARENYKMVANYRPNDSFIQDRLEKCDHELRFLDLIDEADKHYFDDEFEKALSFYKKALEIHPDRKAAKRKDECERLLHKAEMIRKQIEKEQKGAVASLAKEEKETLEKELRKSLKVELRKQIEAELKEKLTTELTNDVEKNAEAAFDSKLWSNISLANSLDVYEFFIQYYPKSAYIDKAKKRLDELSEIVNKQKKKAIEEADSTPDVPADEATEKAKELQERREDSPKKHKPFIKEEKGRSHISEEKPYNILEELEAQFNNGEKAPSKEKTESKEKETPEDIINEVMGDNLVSPKEEKKHKPEPEKTEEKPIENKVEPPKEKEIPKEEKKTISTPPVLEEKSLTEEELWQKAVEAHSLEGYRFYVDNTKESEHLVDAYYQINKLSKMADAGIVEGEEEKNEPEVSIEPTIDTTEESKTVDEPSSLPETPVYETPSYTYSSDDSSTSTTTEDVVNDAPTDSADEEALWAKASEANTVNAYYEYVANSKDKNHLEDAKQRIASLKENARENEKGDWDSAESENTIEAYKAYIKKYPLGHYYAKAMFRISELEAQL